MPLRQASIASTVTPALTQAFQRTVSVERWHTYLIAGGHRQDHAHRLYLWNATIGQSFHYPVQTVEVALRNMVHNVLVKLYGAEWATDAPCRTMLGTKQVREIEKAERRHVKKYGQHPKTPQIVASLSLGFWVTMLTRRYNRIIWQSCTPLAFPALPADKTIVDVAAVARRIQDLRNRVFHQEPLIGRNLSQDYSDILTLLAWICPETREWMRTNSSVPSVMRERPRK